jgi:hypothetical protein
MGQYRRADEAAALLKALADTVRLLGLWPAGRNRSAGKRHAGRHGDAQP